MAKQEKNISTNRLLLLITIVNRRKAEFYSDLIQGLHSNLSMIAMGKGTADDTMLRNLGLSDSDKAVIFSVIKESEEDKVLEVLKEKFESIKDGKGIAYTVPFTSVIGACVFNFLCDNRLTFR